VNQFLNTDDLLLSFGIQLASICDGIQDSTSFNFLLNEVQQFLDDGIAIVFCQQLRERVTQKQLQRKKKNAIAHTAMPYLLHTVDDQNKHQRWI
jgi:hypothetical protein